MAKRRRGRTSTPLMLFWSKREQQRFIEAVERLVSTVNDLDALLAPKRRRRAAKAAADQAAADQAAAAEKGGQGG